MFIPLNKKRKLKKNFLLIPKTLNFKSCELKFGDFGIKSIQQGLIRPNQMESIRKMAKKFVKQFNGSMWFRVFPHFSITKKPIEVRMGKGKGNIEGWYFPVRKGQCIFEIQGLPRNNSLQLLNYCKNKLSFKCKLISKIE